MGNNKFYYFCTANAATLGIACPFLYASHVRYDRACYGKKNVSDVWCVKK